MYLANATTSCPSSALVYQVKHTSRVQHKIQLKPPRSPHLMITKRRKHRDIDCRICQNGCRRFAENLVEPRSISSGRDSKDLQNHLVWNLFHQRHYRRSTMYESTFPKTQIMKFASVRKLQGQLADVFHKVTHSARQSSVISLPPTTRSSVQ